MTLRDESGTPADGAVSRRDFFAGAGLTAGALATLGGIAGTAAAPAALAAVKSRMYASSFVSLELDGQYAGNLLAAVGGEPVIVPGEPIQQVGEGKTTAGETTLRYEPLHLRLGDMSGAVFKWVADASRGLTTPRKVSVITHDFEGQEIYRLAMQGVKPLSIASDGFDGASKDVLRFQLTLAPGQSTHVLGAKSSSSSLVKAGLKSKSILRGNFRLYVQGYESTSLNVRTVDSVGLKARADGVLVPMALKFSLPFKDSAPLFAWMNDTLAGKAGPRQAELQMLTADFSKVAASITFSQLAILRISCPVQATNDVMQMVEVDCAPATLVFNMGDLLT